VLERNAPMRAERYPRCTDATIVALVRDTRDRGYSLQPGLVFEDSWAVAAVVYDPNDAPVAAISIAALRSRLGPARSAALGNRLMQASAELTRLLAG
jgi:DNA-binding IclR family transcriptional regulator